MCVGYTLKLAIILVLFYTKATFADNTTTTTWIKAKILCIISNGTMAETSLQTISCDVVDNKQDDFLNVTKLSSSDNRKDNTTCNITQCASESSKNNLTFVKCSDKEVVYFCRQAIDPAKYRQPSTQTTTKNPSTYDATKNESTVEVSTKISQPNTPREEITTKETRSISYSKYETTHQENPSTGKTHRGQTEYESTHVEMTSISTLQSTTDTSESETQSSDMITTETGSVIPTTTMSSESDTQSSDMISTETGLVTSTATMSSESDTHSSDMTTNVIGSKTPTATKSSESETQSSDIATTETGSVIQTTTMSSESDTQSSNMTTTETRSVTPTATMSSNSDTQSPSMSTTDSVSVTPTATISSKYETQSPSMSSTETWSVNLTTKMSSETQRAKTTPTKSGSVIQTTTTESESVAHNSHTTTAETGETTSLKDLSTSPTTVKPTTSITTKVQLTDTSTTDISSEILSTNSYLQVNSTAKSVTPSHKVTTSLGKTKPQAASGLDARDIGLICGLVFAGLLVIFGIVLIKCRLKKVGLFQRRPCKEDRGEKGAFNDPLSVYQDAVIKLNGGRNIVVNENYGLQHHQDIYGNAGKNTENPYVKAFKKQLYENQSDTKNDVTGEPRMDYPRRPEVTLYKSENDDQGNSNEAAYSSLDHQRIGKDPYIQENTYDTSISNRDSLDSTYNTTSFDSKTRARYVDPMYDHTSHFRRN